MYRTMTKTLFIGAAILLVALAGFAFAVDTWMYPTSVTVMWDPVTTMSDDEPITEGIVHYEIAIAGEDKANPFPLWRGSEVQAVIRLTEGNKTGNLLLGIRTILVIEGVDVETSPYGWTDDPMIVQNGETFGFKLFPPPKTPTGVHIE